jgi:hypothetical protein
MEPLWLSNAERAAGRADYDISPSRRCIWHPLRLFHAIANTAAAARSCCAQIAADELGLPLDNITVKLGDSSLPQAPVEGGSWGAASVGRDGTEFVGWGMASGVWEAPQMPAAARPWRGRLLILRYRHRHLYDRGDASLVSMRTTRPLGMSRLRRRRT